jgi:D-arabinose 1-dehydrogenase-like Zn-dependent alcohol dehydrogenase
VTDGDPSVAGTRDSLAQGIPDGTPAVTSSHDALGGNPGGVTAGNGHAMTDDQVAVALDAVQVGRAAGVGLVVASGARCQGLDGRRVLVGPIDPCGECDVCRSGGAAACPLARRRDALAATAIVAGRWVVPLDDGLELPSPAAAAVAGDVALAYTLYARTGAGPRDPVVVVGESSITRFLIEILVAKGIAPVAVAAAGAWADWLTSKGVTVARDRAAVIEAFAVQSLGTKPWRVLCAQPSASEAATAIAGPRATLILVAPVPAISGEAIARELTIIGVAGAHPDLVVEAAAMCVRGEIDLYAGISQAADPLRTHVRALR